MGRLHLLSGALFLSLFVCSALSMAARRDAPKAAAHRDRVHPVVCATWGIVLGGMVDGRWREPDDIAPHLRGGERYELYTLTQRLGSAVGTKPRLVEGEGYGYAQVLEVTPLPERPGIVLGIGGAWNALPRVPRVERNDRPIYKQAVAVFLRAKGLDIPHPRITQVLRVDLDGDGSDEVLISANSGGPAEEFVWPSEGSYSLVLLRKVVNRKVVTIELAENHLTRVEKDEPTSFAIFSIAALLDLDGDGRMEVLVHGQLYEGDSLTAYRTTRGRAQKLFEEGIGA